MKYDYGFCGLIIESPTLKKIIDKIPDKIVYDNSNNDFGKEKNPHITLLYGFLPDANIQDVKDILSKYKILEFTLADLSLFYNEDYDVLKIGVESELLKEINSKMRDLPCEILHQEYKPHLTLAYLIKNPLNKKLERQFKKIKLKSNQIKFTDSEGNTTFFKLS